LNPKNKGRSGIAVEISLLSCVQIKIYAIKVRGRHLGFSTSGYLLISVYDQYNTTGMFLAENVGVAVNNVFPSSVELKIYYMLYIVHKLYLLLPVLSRQLVLYLFCFHHLTAISSSGKVTEAFQFTLSGYEMASKIVAWGVFLPVISTTKVKCFIAIVSGRVVRDYGMYPVSSVILPALFNTTISLTLLCRQ